METPTCAFMSASAQQHQQHQQHQQPGGMYVHDAAANGTAAVYHHQKAPPPPTAFLPPPFAHQFVKSNGVGGCGVSDNNGAFSNGCLIPIETANGVYYEAFDPKMAAKMSALQQQSASALFMNGFLDVNGSTIPCSAPMVGCDGGYFYDISGDATSASTTGATALVIGASTDACYGGHSSSSYPMTSAQQHAAAYHDMHGSASSASPVRMMCSIVIDPGYGSTPSPSSSSSNSASISGDCSTAANMHNTSSHQGQYGCQCVVLKLHHLQSVHIVIAFADMILFVCLFVFAADWAGPLSHCLYLKIVYMH